MKKKEMKRKKEKEKEFNLIKLFILKKYNKRNI